MKILCRTDSFLFVCSQAGKTVGIIRDMLRVNSNNYAVNEIKSNSKAAKMKFNKKKY